MIGVTRKDRKRNTWLREKTGVKDIIRTVKEYKIMEVGRSHWAIRRREMDKTDNRMATTLW